MGESAGPGLKYCPDYRITTTPCVSEYDGTDASEALVRSQLSQHLRIVKAVDPFAFQ